jgi:hypothetical protein
MTSHLWRRRWHGAPRAVAYTLGNVSYSLKMVEWRA